MNGVKFPAAYEKYATQMKDLEVIGAMLWDSVTYTSAATVQATFFTATRATLDLSNMEVAGQLAAPKAFLIRAIRVYAKQRSESVNAVGAGNAQTGAIDNIAQLINTGALTMTVGAKRYMEFPLWKMSAGGGVWSVFQVSNILIGGAYADHGQFGAAHARNIYTLSKPLFLEPQVNFRVDIFWAAALTLTRNTVITVALEGDLFRPVQ